jgi:Rieske 2Fe-2S family protein
LRLVPPLKWSASMALTLNGSTIRSPITPDEVAATRRPTLEAHTLPARVHLDPAVFEYEMEAWYRRCWLMVGREEDLPETGSFLRADLFGEDVVLVRGNDQQIRAFYNVCRHRGATLVLEDSGRIARFQCPYHAWVYDLEGRLRPPRHTDQLANFSCAENSLRPVHVASMAGYLFLNLDPDAAPFDTFAGDLPALLARFRLGELRRASRKLYDVRANWKVIAENALECYHCPGVHPLLNKLTPPGLGGLVANTPDWSLSWMELGIGYETMSIDGRLNGRPTLPSLDSADVRRVYYVWIWPNLLFSVNPDYMRSLQFWPIDAGHSRIVYDVYFHQDALAQPDFDPSGPVEFSDLIVREDLAVCELQQRGITSRGYTPGRYAQIEGATHRFDAKVADLYANDSQTTVVTRERDYYRVAD